MREDFIEVILFDPEEDKISDNLAAWYIIYIDSRSIVIDLDITRPLLISQGDNPDQLLISLNFLSVEDIYGAHMTEKVFKMVNMPR